LATLDSETLFKKAKELKSQTEQMRTLVALLSEHIEQLNKIDEMMVESKKLAHILEDAMSVDLNNLKQENHHLEALIPTLQQNVDLLESYKKLSEEIKEMRKEIKDND
jgi:uncharacterized membrane protein YgaE (UPF0421/DUF939 family)